MYFMEYNLKSISCIFLLLFRLFLNSSVLHKQTLNRTHWHIFGYDVIEMKIISMTNSHVCAWHCMKFRINWSLHFVFTFMLGKLEFVKFFWYSYVNSHDMKEWKEKICIHMSYRRNKWSWKYFLWRLFWRVCFISSFFCEWAIR